MKTFEERLAALEAKAGIQAEPWKPSKPTLCWVSDDDAKEQSTVDVVDRYNAEKKYPYLVKSSINRCWVYATPLTRAEVLEYLDDSEPKPTVEKRCGTCAFYATNGKQEPCWSCIYHAYWQPKLTTKKPTRYDWSKAPKEARYWTTDSDGRQDWWVEKPICKNGRWIPFTYDHLPIAKEEGDPCPDAEASLEARPV